MVSKSVIYPGHFEYLKILFQQTANTLDSEHTLKLIQFSETLHYCSGLPCMCAEANLKPGCIPHHRWFLKAFAIDSGWLHTQAAQKCVQDLRHGLQDPFLQPPPLCDPPSAL